MDLEGRVAIVTGGAAGAGTTMVQRRAGEGVVPDRIASERALDELAAMAPEERAAEKPLVDPGDLADAVVELIRDESLAGRVVLLPRGEPRRLLDAS